ncbi:MAG: type II secretion system protein [Phycisphaerae bacterium]
MRTCTRGRLTAFTLIELLAVVAIIALLVSILVPSLRTAREMARAVPCKVNMRMVGLGINSYANDNTERMPASMILYRSSPVEYWTWWPDFIVKYFDTDARPVPDLYASSNAGYWESVAIQPSNNVWSGNHWGVPFTFSRRFDCAAQKNADKYEYTWNPEDSWSLVIGRDDPNLYSWNRPKKIGDYRDLSRYCQVFEPDHYGWRTCKPAATWCLTPLLSYGLPHLKAMNGVMLDGHVEVFTDKFMMLYGGSDVPNGLYRTQAYPFAIPWW